MSTETVSKQPVEGFGYNGRRAWAKFTPVDGANPTIISNFGFASIVRTSEGLWTLTLAERYADMAADAYPVISDANFHEVEVRSAVPATGVVTVTHKWCTYATIVSAGPVLDDVAGLTTITVEVVAVQG